MSKNTLIYIVFAGHQKSHGCHCCNCLHSPPREFFDPSKHLRSKLSSSSSQPVKINLSKYQPKDTSVPLAIKLAKYDVFLIKAKKGKVKRTKKKKNYISCLLTVEKCEKKKKRNHIVTQHFLLYVKSEFYSYDSYTNEHNTIFETFEPM